MKEKLLESCKKLFCFRRVQVRRSCHSQAAKAHAVIGGTVEKARYYGSIHIKIQFAGIPEQHIRAWRLLAAERL